MKVKSIKLSEIKTPKTVKEFRENLKKYFAGIGEDALYVQGTHLGIKYEDINSFGDIYDATGMGFGHRNSSSPMIIPLIEFDFDEILKQKAKNMPAYSEDMSNWMWFHDDYEVYENEVGILSKMKNPQWFSLDNKVLREFYMHVLGEYAGYGLLSDYAPSKMAV